MLLIAIAISSRELNQSESNSSCHDDLRLVLISSFIEVGIASLRDFKDDTAISRPPAPQT